MVRLILAWQCGGSCGWAVFDASRYQVWILCEDFYFSSNNSAPLLLKLINMHCMNCGVWSLPNAGNSWQLIRSNYYELIASLGLFNFRGYSICIGHWSIPRLNLWETILGSILCYLVLRDYDMLSLVSTKAEFEPSTTQMVSLSFRHKVAGKVSWKAVKKKNVVMQIFLKEKWILWTAQSTF